MISDLKDGLTDRYNILIDQDKAGPFLAGLNGYIQYIFQHPILKHVLNGEYEKRNELYKKLEKYESTAISELEGAEKRLQKITREIEHPVLSLEGFDKNGDLIVREKESGALEYLLNEAAAYLLSVGYKEELKEFLVSNETYREYYCRINGNASTLSNSRGNFIFSATWPETFKQKRIIATQRDMEPWGAFENLIMIKKAREAVAQGENIGMLPTKLMLDKEYPLDAKRAGETYSLAEDIKTLSQKGTIFEDRLKKFKVIDLKEQVIKVHHVLLNKLSEAPIMEPKKIKEKTTPTADIAALIQYNPQSGAGFVNEKHFKFKDHQPEYRIFGMLWEKINKKIRRYDVLVAAHFYEDGEELDPDRRGAETLKINEIVTKMRKRTGLTTDQLANNNGNLTLIGKRNKSTLNQP